MPEEPRKPRKRKSFDRSVLPPINYNTWTVKPPKSPAVGGMKMTTRPSGNPPAASIGMRMTMGMEIGVGTRQMQTMTFSPRLRNKPLTKKQREALFRVTGKKA